MNANVKPLTLEERVATGCSHVAEISIADLAAVAALTATLQLAPYVAGDIVDKFYYELPTSFDGGSATALTAKAGWAGTASSDDDGLLAATSIHADATPVIASAGTGTKLAAVESGVLNLILTATTANISTLTSGKLRAYFNIVHLPGLRGINGD